MQNAAQILQTSDFSINKVSEKLGYSSPFQFSRDFKKYYGVSPNSYRKKIKKNRTDFHISPVFS